MSSRPGNGKGGKKTPAKTRKRTAKPSRNGRVNKAAIVPPSEPPPQEKAPEEIPPKRRAGRPKGSKNKDTLRPQGGVPKLNHTVARHIFKLIRRGNQIETAAVASGVSRMSLHNWMKRGQKVVAEAKKARTKAVRELGYQNAPSLKTLIPKDEWIYVWFVKGLHTANAQAEIRDVKKLNRNGAGDWRADAFKLTHRYKRWKQEKQHKHEHAHKHAGQIDQKHTHLHGHISLDQMSAELKKQVLDALPLELKLKMLEETDAADATHANPVPPDNGTNGSVKEITYQDAEIVSEPMPE